MAEEMYHSILKMVKEVHESLLLEEDIVLYILYLFKWSKDRLYEEYYDKAKKFQEKNACLKNSLLEHGNGPCGICCEEK